MNRITALCVLMLAALLESGGDAVMRMALQSSSASARRLLFLAASIVLAAYGWTVNTPAWDFGKMIGIYVALFFIIGQAISWTVFRQQPSVATIVAGLMIVGGAAVFTVGNQ